MHFKSRLILFIALLINAAVFIGGCSKSNPVTSTPPAVTELQGTYAGSLAGATYIDDTSYIFTFATDTVTLRDAVGQDTTVRYNGIFSLDTAVAPDRITIHITKSTVYKAGSIDSAIFSFSGNVLKISANAPGTSQPSALDGTSPYYSLIQ
jgi:uncharacterized protein (TIGR03067 family)